MLKFMITNFETKRRILGLVITKEHVEKLQKNTPIHVHSEQLGLNEIECEEIIINYFDTIDDAIQVLGTHLGPRQKLTRD